LSNESENVVVEGCDANAIRERKGREKVGDTQSNGKVSAQNTDVNSTPGISGIVCR